LFDSGSPEHACRKTSGRDQGALFLAVSGLGVSAFISQLVLMREMLCVFSGNELVLGIVLGNWLLLTGIGAHLGRTASRLRDPIRVLVAAQLSVAVLPVAQVYLLRTLRHVIFTRGSAVGVTETVVACFVLLAPYCLVAGYSLTLASLVLSVRRDSASIGEVYFLDNVGDVLGGVAFSVFILFDWFDHIRILCVPALLNLFLAIVVAVIFGRRLLLAASCLVAAAFVGISGFYDVNEVSTQALYPGQRILYAGNSAYGSLVVTELAGQLNFIENGVSLFSTENIEQVEETVHYAMAQRPDAERVLLISGGVSGTAKEILRYGVDVVDYVELDPLILHVAKRYIPQNFSDPRIHVINTDGRRFVRQSTRSYHVAIVDVPDPSTSQLNRFYTREFFGEIADRVHENGVLCISLGHYENYLSQELSDLIAVAHRTLKEAFDNVLILPAGRVYYLASNGPLTTDVASRIEGRGIHTQLVKRHYLKRVLTPDRLAAVRRAVSSDARVNRDFSPILYYYHLRYWMSQFDFKLGILEVGLAIILVTCLARMRAPSFAIFTTGLAGSALMVVLLVGFQILCGSVYHQVAIIVTMFMIGLGIGSFTMNRMLSKQDRKNLAWLELAVTVYAACVPFLLPAIGEIRNASIQAIVSQWAVPLMALTLAVLVGLEFPLAGKATRGAVSDAAARMYTADYLGAALGALFVSTLLIPVMGVVAVCLLAAGLNLISGAVVYWTSRG
jgi:spermidine synthase